MPEKKKWIEAVSKLIQLTQKGELSWDVVRGDEALVPVVDGVELVFVTDFRGRTLRLYKRTKQVEGPEAGDLVVGSSAWQALPISRDYPFQVERVVLEFVDNLGNSLWKFPYTDALDDLYEAVEYQVAEVDEFLNELLEADE